MLYGLRSGDLLANPSGEYPHSLKIRRPEELYVASRYRPKKNEIWANCTPEKANKGSKISSLYLTPVTVPLSKTWRVFSHPK
ncbi:hypothetical protein AVEN_197333-1 [Araneus ventricosus]|uniref:Uncharacterized protein n=1 Tax=Araneus ventricosus TaxID=182803 RepID=A0A4Y2IWA6_ARAVE|nr:hypothetical protein AVEN_197333-1 [Araneus ventricosus]